MPWYCDDRTSEAASEKNPDGEQLSRCDEHVEARALFVQEGRFRVVVESVDQEVAYRRGRESLFVTMLDIRLARCFVLACLSVRD
jgi:hypothetical protein